MQSFSIKTSFPWTSTNLSNCQIHICGACSNIEQIVAAFQRRDLTALRGLLHAERETFGIVLVDNDYCIAATDRVSGYPIYLMQTNQGLELSNDVTHWLSPSNNFQFDEQQVRTFLAGGYTINTDSLFRNVRRLLPSEICEIRPGSTNSHKLTFSRYYLLQPTLQSHSGNETDWEDRFETAFEKSIQRVIDRANGAKIWIPLSAGYDSRAVLARLLASGYDNISTFSYGVPGNDEARVAQDIAQKARVEWRFLSSCVPNPKQEILSDEITQYMQFAGGLSTTPSLTEYFTLRELRRNGDYQGNDIVINGQSGDFLTGGHLPPSDSIATIQRYCLTKHFSLFKGKSQQIGEDESDKIFSDWLQTHLNVDINGANKTEVLRGYLALEWQERQSHYVVQQQRAYDFFDLHWALPLWDADLLDLYDQAPHSEHINQNLYLRYLKKWNYKGLFDYGRLPYNPWPKHGQLFRIAANLARFIGGNQLKQETYRHLYYWSDNNYQYRLFGNKIFREFIKELRNPVSLIALEYLSQLRFRLEIPPVNPLEKRFNRFRQRSLNS